MVQARWQNPPKIKKEDNWQENEAKAIAIHAEDAEVWGANKDNV